MTYFMSHHTFIILLGKTIKIFTVYCCFKLVSVFYPLFLSKKDIDNMTTHFYYVNLVIQNYFYSKLIVSH